MDPFVNGSQLVYYINTHTVCACRARSWNGTYRLTSFASVKSFLGKFSEVVNTPFAFLLGLILIRLLRECQCILHKISGIELRIITVFHELKDLCLMSSTNCLTSFLHEHKVVNMPFALLSSFRVWHTKPHPPLATQDANNFIMIGISSSLGVGLFVNSCLDSDSNR